MHFPQLLFLSEGVLRDLALLRVGGDIYICVLCGAEWAQWHRSFFWWTHIYHWSLWSLLVPESHSQLTDSPLDLDIGFSPVGLGFLWGWPVILPELLLKLTSKPSLECPDSGNKAGIHCSSQVNISRWDSHIPKRDQHDKFRQAGDSESTIVKGGY